MVSCFKGKFRVTSPRGWRTLNGKKDYHKGVDLVGVDDTTVYAVADGVIEATPYEANGFGYYVRQTLSDGKRLYYGHLKAGSVCVKVGQAVRKGDKLGVMGNTGNSFGAHTHLELRPAGTSSDSLDICEFTRIPNKVGLYEYKEGKTMANRFNDIKGSIAEKEIEQLCDMGIVQGDGNSKFRPKEALTREEAALLVRRVIMYITGK